jgi:hypothetical protein
MILQLSLNGMAFHYPPRIFLLAAAVMGIGLTVPAKAQQKELPLPSLNVPADIAATHLCLLDESKKLKLDRKKVRAGYVGWKARCTGVDSRDTAKVQACVDEAEDHRKALARHREASEDFEKQKARIHAQSGCVIPGEIRPTTGYILWNFVNYCKTTKHISVCAEYGNGTRNNLGSSPDLPKCGSGDISLRPGYVKTCWIEGPNACPCK